MPATPQVSSRHQKEALQFLEETFEAHHGIYIDKGTSLLETLANVTAAEASRRASPQTASLAAHVRHVVYYIEVLQKVIRGEPTGELNWREIWENDRPVTPQAWAAQVAALRQAYAGLLSLHADPATWEQEDALGGFTSVSIHTAYHLGAIRQALSVIRSRPGAGAPPSGGI